MAAWPPVSSCRPFAAPLSLWSWGRSARPRGGDGLERTRSIHPRHTVSHGGARKGSIAFDRERRACGCGCEPTGDGSFESQAGNVTLPTAVHKLTRLDHAYLWHPFTQMRDWLKHEPVVVVSGKGALLRDLRGRHYL